MNRKLSAGIGAVGAVALAASLVSVIPGAPANAASAQFCQENCNNSGYKYFFKRLVSGNTTGETRKVFIDCEGPDEANTDSLDIDFFGALSIFILTSTTPGVDIHTDANGRPIGITLPQGRNSPATPVPLVCFDDRAPVHVK